VANVSNVPGKEGNLKEAHDEEGGNPTDLKKPDAENEVEETEAEGADDADELKSQETPDKEKNGIETENATKTEEGEVTEVV